MALLAGCGSEEQQPAPVKASAVEAPPDVPVMGAERSILAFGDSLFTGYGLEAGEGYPERLEAALRARGINARIVNGGVSGDTTAAGRQRLAFALDSQSRPPELVLISLGGNDMLRGISPEQTRENLDAMLAELQKRGIPAVLMGMLSPPNLGSEYRAKFDPIYPALAKKYDAKLVPFFLEPVLDRPGLVQQDHIHPTAEGIDAMVNATVDDAADALPKDQAFGPT
ncbi:MAG TPA: arylesterase [Devosia sp.]|nr:arylesterase [Devosia sp.]